MTSLDRMRELRASGRSPFELRFAKDAWDDGALAGDVAAVHRAESSALIRLVESTARDGRTRAALVLGETGSGKTHVLARLRRATADRAIFIAASSPRPDDVLGSLIDAAAIDLRRPATAASRRAQLAALVDPLVTLFAPVALGDALETVRPCLTSEELDDRPALAARILERCFPEAIAAKVPECPVELIRALLVERTSAAGSLDGALAGIDPGRVLRGLGALGARAGVPIVLTLDQNDAVEARALAGAVTRLHAASGLVVAVTFLRTLWDTRRDALIEPERQRMEECRVVLEAPSVPEVLAFIEARLEPAPGTGISPFTAQDLDQIAARSGRLPLRDWCRALDALLVERVAPVAPARTVPVPVPGPAADLARRLNALEAKIRADLPEGEGPLREALALVLAGSGTDSVKGPLEPDGALDLLVSVGAERVGYKVLDAERAPAFARRLEAVLNEIDAGTVHRAFVLRTRELPESWRQCRKLADDLRARGGDVMVLGEEERAALHAIARLDGAPAGTIGRSHPVVRRLLERPAAVTT